MSQLQNDIFKSLEEDSEIYDVLLFVARSLRILFYLAYHSPLLGIHLKWLATMSSPPASQQHIPDTDLGSTHDATESSEARHRYARALFNPQAAKEVRYQKAKCETQIKLGILQESSCQIKAGKEGQALDSSEVTDIVPDCRFLRLGTDRMFLIHDRPATSIPRRLRPIKLRTCSIESLVLTKTCDKLKELGVKILQTSLPQVDIDMEPLDAYIKRPIPDPEDQASFSEEIE